MSYSGGCRCGAITYRVSGEPVHACLCHCTDCVRSAGAPVVGWALFRQDEVAIHGTPVDYQSSPGTTRRFCGTCGTGLFFLNETVFPGQVDIQFATFDDPEALPPRRASRWQTPRAGSRTSPSCRPLPVIREDEAGPILHRCRQRVPARTAAAAVRVRHRIAIAGAH